MNKNLKVETFPMGSLSCNCSLIYSNETKECIVVDPGDDFDSLMKIVNERGLILKHLLHTHAHFDHIGCSKTVKEKTGAKIHLHNGDKLLYKALPAQAMMFGFSPRMPASVDSWIEDEEEFSFEHAELKNFLKALYTPGHTEGSCCFYTDYLENPILFSGDTLFQNSIGRTDLPGGDFDKIKKSIKNRLYTLPDETVVITGHGPTTMLYKEKNNNPFVR